LTISVPGLARTLGLSRTAPLECFNRSTARPSSLVVWFSATRGFGQFLLWDTAGRALQDHAPYKPIDHSSFAPPRSIGQVTLGLDNFPPNSRFPVAGLSTLTDPPGDVPGCGRDKSINSFYLCLNSEIHDVPNVSTNVPAPCRLSTVLFPTI